MIWHWFLYSFTGASNEPGAAYGFWSGFGGSWLLGYTGLALLYVWHHNCHVHRCWRLGRRKVGDYVVCRRHHPQPEITVGHVAAEHAKGVMPAGVIHVEGGKLSDAEVEELAERLRKAARLRGRTARL